MRISLGLLVFLVAAPAFAATVSIVRSETTYSEYSGKAEKCDGSVISPMPVIKTSTRVGFDKANVARIVYSNIEIHDCKGIQGPDTTSYIRDDQQVVAVSGKQLVYDLNAGLAAASEDCPLTVQVDSQGKVKSAANKCVEHGP